MTNERWEYLSNLPQWEEGMNAHQGGMAEAFNPYPAGTDEHRAWMIGFTDAEEGSKPK